MKTQPLPSQAIKSSFTVINSVVNDLIKQSKDQATSNKLISRLMNPYTSDKVNSTINEIGNLIYQEAEDSQLEKKFNHFAQSESPKYMEKDNMFTNGVAFDQSQEGQTSQFNKDQRQSVQSIMTSLSKLPIHASSIDNSHRNQEQINSTIPIPSKKRQQNSSKSSHLISLQPQQSNKNRTSAFIQSQTQYLQQKMIEVQINDFREQKVLQQENRKKSMQKEKKLTNLISNDEVIMTFDYTGDIIKKTKRQLAQQMNSKNNQKIVETGLLIKDSQKFWKSKNNKNPSRQFNESSSSFIANQSHINQLKNKPIKLKEPSPKRTTIEKIEELKKKSILVSLKNKISDSQNKIANKKGPQLNSIPMTGINGQKLSQEEQTNLKQHHFEFLSKNLNSYHEKEQNFMPEWVQKVEKGCKMTIFLGDGEEEKVHEKQKRRNMQRMQKKSHRSLSDRSEKTSKMNETEQKQILSPKKSKKNGIQGNLHEIKHIQNLKTVQLTQGQIIEEWQKRVHIKSVDNKYNATKQRKSSSNLKNSRPVSVQESKEITRKNTNIQDQSDSRVNISKELQILKASSKNLKQSRFDTIQDEDAKSQYSFSNIQIQPKTKLNLNKNEFEKLKKYLKNKNSIVTRNETIKKDSMEFFLISDKKQPKRSQILNSSENKPNTTVLSHSVYTVPTVQTQSHIEYKSKQNAYPINQQQQESTINEKRLSEKHRRLFTLAWKPRSFSVNDKRYSPCKSEAQPKIKAKLEGSIKINNQKLKHSLLRDTVDFDLSSSSILNTNHASKSKLKSSYSEIKWQLTQKSRLKSIRQSEKQLLSTESQANSSKVVEIPQTINFNEVSLSRPVGKQTPKTQSTSIVVNRPRPGIVKTNLLKNAVQ